MAEGKGNSRAVILVVLIVILVILLLVTVIMAGLAYMKLGTSPAKTSMLIALITLVLGIVAAGFMAPLGLGLSKNKFMGNPKSNIPFIIATIAAILLVVVSVVLIFMARGKSGVASSEKTKMLIAILTGVLSYVPFVIIAILVLTTKPMGGSTMLKGSVSRTAASPSRSRSSAMSGSKLSK